MAPLRPLGDPATEPTPPLGGSPALDKGESSPVSRQGAPKRQAPTPPHSDDPGLRGGACLLWPHWPALGVSPGNGLGLPRSGHHPPPGAPRSERAHPQPPLPEGQPEARAGRGTHRDVAVDGERLRRGRAAGGGGRGRLRGGRRRRRRGRRGQHEELAVELVELPGDDAEALVVLVEDGLEQLQLGLQP